MASLDDVFCRVLTTEGLLGDIAILPKWHGHLLGDQHYERTARPEHERSDFSITLCLMLGR